MERYIRQTLLPEIGQEGQEKLKHARILIIGVGGIGCPAALYLTAAGVGTLGLIDHDTVSLSNLQRQVLYTESEVGKLKTTCAAQRLKELNSQINVKEYPFKLEPENAEEIISQYDLVIDGCDNYPTRYLISDTCKALNIPYIYGAITEYSGQVAILCHGKESITYRQLFPEDEKKILTTHHSSPKAPSPVIGTTPAIIGVIQANEALKLICEYGQPLINKLWIIDLLSLQTNIISL